jgi:hypothetical protein
MSGIGRTFEFEHIIAHNRRRGPPCPLDVKAARRCEARLATGTAYVLSFELTKAAPARMKMAGIPR